MLNAELRVTSGKQSGHVIPLVASRFLIGREEDCHLRPNSDLVSRHHCVFKIDEYSLRIRDLGSTNGTLVNGERIRGEVMLNSGDRVSVGKLEFEVAIGNAVPAPVAAAAASNASDPTDSFELGETPSQSATVELSAATASSPDETVYEPPPPEQSTPVQDTASLQAADTMPGGATPPPGYGQPPIGYTMPYPQQPYPYAQPYGMPMMGYPQQPMAYPQMGMYPPQPMPMPPQPQAPQPPPAEPPASGGAAAPDVRLPDPGQTGIQPPQPKPENNGNQKSDEAVMRDTAADIIKQYTQRRPQV